ncbi:MAG: glycosyltransferase family 2 protein [Acutalibacteraceae bacterium]
MIVSLCVIAYNEEKVLNGLFRAIKEQSYPHEKIEVVLVDSCSTDKTKEMMEDFKKSNYGFKDVKILDNPKKNQASGWNIAIKNSTGDIITRIDAHAKIPRHFIARSVSHIIEGENIVGGPRPTISSFPTPWSTTLLAAEESLFGSSIASYRRQNATKSYENSLFHASYKREVFEKAGIFDETLGRTEDNEMHYRIRKAGYKLCFCPDIISYQHTRNNLRKMIKQKFSNGYWIGLTLGVCKECLSYYHFVPFLFVMGLTFSTVFALCGFPWFLYILCGLYLMFDLVNTASCFITRDIKPQFLLLPFIFPVLHISYGLGTLVGIIKMPFFIKHRKENGR